MPLKDSSANPSVEPLRRVSDLWLDPMSPIRLRAIRALQVSTGYSETAIQRAIENVFGELARDKLLEFIRSEKIPFGSRSPAIVLHVGAGNVFTSWLHGAVISILLGYQTWVKPSSQEPIFANLWHQSVQMIDFQLASRIRIVPWEENLLSQVQALVAYGSDETLEHLRRQSPRQVVFIGYGHKLSVAVALKESMQAHEWPHWRQAALDDCELFDLSGCLSPQRIFVEGSDSGPWRELIQTLNPAPALQTFSDFSQLLSELKGFGNHLSAMGVAGPMDRLNAIRQDIEDLGPVRVCALGQMQRPPLSWRNGGISLVQKLSELGAFPKA